MVEDPQPLWELGLGGTLLVASVLLHGIGMWMVQRRFLRAWPREPDARVRRQLVFASLIAMMLATHLAQMGLWAFALTAIGAVATFREAFYFAAVTYTTLGYEETKLPMPWRLLAPFMAMAGVFAFGWTTGVLVSLVTRANQAYSEDPGAGK
jgi:hypothetical protein